MADSLQKQTFSGIIWGFLQKFILQLFGFAQGIVLARLLSPSDYGLIGMTAIFFGISYTLIDSGFSLALVRKKDRTDIDYSTVYVTNMVLSFFFGLVLFLCAPLIARFYKQPILADIVRVNAVYMFALSFIAVQNTRLTIQLRFKVLSIISVISTIITGICSMAMAFMGFGVWSLVYPNFLNIVVMAALYWHYQHWFPGLRFSWASWREFFSFGSRILATNLLEAIYGNLGSLVIGRAFSAKQLGYYTKAGDYAKLPAATITNVLGRVTFPVLSKIQDDGQRLAASYRTLIRVTAFVIFPAMVGLAALARPFIIGIITEKWAPSIILLVILCFGNMWPPISALNLNLLQIKGRPELFLRLQVVQKVLGVLMLFLAIPFGLTVLAAGMALVAFFCVILNTYYTGRLIHVGYLMQMRDMLPSLLGSLSMGVVVVAATWFIPNMLVQLAVGIPLGMAYYIGVAKLFRSKELDYIVQLLRTNVLHRK